MSNFRMLNDSELRSSTGCWKKAVNCKTLIRTRGEHTLQCVREEREKVVKVRVLLVGGRGGGYYNRPSSQPFLRA